MQIHELNDFYGALGSGSYLAIDNGTDTGRISKTALFADTEARIDNIIAGDAPSAEEIIDARTGTDGSVYATLGSAIRDQIRGIQNTMSNRDFNILDFIKKENKTSHGITFTWNDDGTCTVTGTSTASTVSCNIFYKTNAFPPFMYSGQPIQLRMESDSATPVVRADVFKCINGSLSSTWVSGIKADYQGDGVYYGTVPTGLSGILIRIAVSGNGTTANETVRLSITPQECMDNVPRAANFTTDANDLKRNGIYFVGSNTIANIPDDGMACWLDVKCIGDQTSTGVLQIVYPWASATHNPYFRVCRSGAWTDWKQLGSSGGGGGTVIENTYNITTSPTITTDTNGWLQAVDTNTSSEAGKTDMTGAIMSMLTDTGYCKLSKGIFYVSGSIDMPEGSTLEGCGEDTIIRLLSSVSAGYCVKVEKFNTVRGIRFSGGYSDYSPTSTIGTRNGLNFTSNADTETTTVEQCVIDNCWIENFNGSGIYSNNTGASVNRTLTVTNTYIQRCSAGINISYYSEYQKYTNVVVYRCYYACINNGGNNIFVGCTFHGTVGFTLGNLTNNAHGSCVGCSFNHIGGGTGLAVNANGTTTGFIFTGCQIWYGGIQIQNSKGIAFSDCLLGGNSPEITVSGNYPAFFSNCIFHATPTLDVNTSTKFDNCYLDSTGGTIGA